MRDPRHTLSLHGEAARQAERAEHARLQYDDVWRTLPPVTNEARRLIKDRHFPLEPEENLPVRFNRDTDRTLALRRQKARARPLASDDADQVMKHLARLRGFRVRLEERDVEGSLMAWRQQDPATQT